jgi:hypothetical protein
VAAAIENANTTNKIPIKRGENRNFISFILYFLKYD